MKERNVPHLNPQNNFTGLNNIDVVTGGVFGILYEEINTTFIHGKASVFLRVLPTQCHISARKTAEQKIPLALRNRQGLLLETGETSLYKKPHMDVNVMMCTVTPLLVLQCHLTE